MEKKFINVKYLPTGMIFNVSKETVDEYIKDEPHNFKVMDDDYDMPEEEKIEQEVYELVVEKEKAEEPIKATKKTSKKK